MFWAKRNLMLHSTWWFRTCFLSSAFCYNKQFVMSRQCLSKLVKCGLRFRCLALKSKHFKAWKLFCSKSQEPRNFSFSFFSHRRLIWNLFERSQKRISKSRQKSRKVAQNLLLTSKTSKWKSTCESVAILKSSEQFRWRFFYCKHPLNTS